MKSKGVSPARPQRKLSPKRPRPTAEISMSFLSFEDADGESDVIELEDGAGKRHVKLDDLTSPPKEPEPQG